MKQIILILIFVQLLLGNPPFSSEEKSVFGQPTQKIEEVKNKEILTYEEKQSEPSSAQTHTKSRSDELLKSIAESFHITKEKKPVKLNEESVTAPQEVIAESNETTTQENASAPQKSIEDASLSEENEETMAVATQTNEEEMSADESIPVDLPVIDYFTQVEFENLNPAKKLYLSYPSYPKKIYKNQRFEVVVKALVTTEGEYKVETRFIDSVNMTVLNPSNEWILTQSNTFENRYYFKAFDNNFKMPTFQIILYKNNEIVDVEYLKPEELSFTEIGKDDEKFSSVIASELKIKAYKTKQYNNNELITILDVEAYESNLEDFFLRYVQEQGFSKIVDNYPNQEMLYYLVMPIHKKKIVFNYYNSKSKKFKKITVPIVLENELVSTQTDLNPNNSNILFYKKVGLSVLSVLFLILFVWKRKYIYLIMLMIAVIFLIIYLMPNKQAFVKGDTTIYILPTKNSTIFYKTKKTNLVQVAMKKENFVKIILNLNDKKIIGWIKEDKLVEN